MVCFFSKCLLIFFLPLPLVIFRTSSFVTIVIGDPESIMKVYGCLLIRPLSTMGGIPNLRTTLSSFHSELPSDWSSVWPMRFTRNCPPLSEDQPVSPKLAFLGRFRMKWPVIQQLRHFSFLSLHTIR